MHDLGMAHSDVWPETAPASWNKPYSKHAHVHHKSESEYMHTAHTAHGSEGGHAYISLRCTWQREQRCTSAACPHHVWANDVKNRRFSDSERSAPFVNAWKANLRPPESAMSSPSVSVPLTCLQSRLACEYARVPAIEARL
jgi:hypothetical protein